MSSPYSASRFTNLHLTGNLWLARRNASRATSSETPAISNITLPRLTGATQPSGVPLPEPIRTPIAFAVYDLCGKILIQTLPPRFM
ncbi:ribosomal protein [Streptococcus agalactiae COH1]|nr:ribosomal protein [Streptococcus agalactiae COH1]